MLRALQSWSANKFDSTVLFMEQTKKEISSKSYSKNEPITFKSSSTLKLNSLSIFFNTAILQLN